ncbi:uncharacterized protein AB675_4603 [Cyphellophora attinorum]|uniref:Uncharacterized protein n=1 Tax=Cyphellophora attinorum TaxID=1664694 RepID=A0A0N1H7N1_9EURO|nr:uncharacterized protein AB675_4603 [Phialophora attinorum]KPI39082.1 hypothetical protein AB675_4603 [Phialophora attinorum]
MEYDFSHLREPVGANGEELIIEYPSRRGEKVKGRPKPKNAPVSGGSAATSTTGKDAPASKTRTTGNTHPRKQPFKSQVSYDGYPDATAPVPPELTLYEVCQKMPNSLRENTLQAFLQAEWSANELFTCLPTDVQDILKARPGKDKTMIYQKRLERMKKDLEAKGELQALMAAPKLRADGRPNYVKRGNIRRS